MPVKPGSVAPDAERLPGVSRGQHGGREERLQGGAEKGLRPAQRARARELAAPGVDRLVRFRTWLAMISIVGKASLLRCLCTRIFAADGVAAEVGCGSCAPQV